MVGSTGTVTSVPLTLLRFCANNYATLQLTSPSKRRRLKLCYHNTSMSIRIIRAGRRRPLATLSAAVDKLERWLEWRCPDGVRVQRVMVSIQELQDVIPTFSVEG